MSDSEKEITAAEAAIVLGVDRSVVLKRVKSGELTPSRKLPGRTGAFLFRARDIAKKTAA